MSYCSTSATAPIGPPSARSAAARDKQRAIERVQAEWYAEQPQNTSLGCRAVTTRECDQFGWRQDHCTLRKCPTQATLGPCFHGSLRLANDARRRYLHTTDSSVPERITSQRSVPLTALRAMGPGSSENSGTESGCRSQERGMDLPLNSPYHAVYGLPLQAISGSIRPHRTNRSQGF